MEELQRETHKGKQSVYTYTCQPWHLSIVSKSRRGNRSIMEDRVWFEPPFQQGDTTYIQCCVIDGHSTFPLELESFFESCKQKLKQPFDNSIEQWQELVNKFDSRWSSKGGLVCHFVSIQFSSKKKLKLVRQQIGDGNSLFVSPDRLHVPLMYVHNTSQIEELHRVLPHVEHGRVGGVLACTRVIGNKELKSTLPPTLLDPILRKETHTIPLQNPKGFLLCGTDGLMSDRSCIHWLSNHPELQDTHSIQLAEECMSRAGMEDNVSFIVIEFLYLRIKV